MKPSREFLIGVEEGIDHADVRLGSIISALSEAARRFGCKPEIDAEIVQCHAKRVEGVERVRQQSLDIACNTAWPRGVGVVKTGMPSTGSQVS